MKFTLPGADKESRLFFKGRDINNFVEELLRIEKKPTTINRYLSLLSRINTRVKDFLN